MSVQHLASALNQAAFQTLLPVLNGLLPRDVNPVNGVANRVDGAGNTMPTLYNDWKTNTPAVFDQVCFFLATGKTFEQFRGTLRKTYFLDIEVWTRSHRQDSAETYYAAFSPVLNVVQLDVSQFDPLCFVEEVWDVGSIDLAWDNKIEAYKALYRYKVVAGRLAS